MMSCCWSSSRFYMLHEALQYGSSNLKVRPILKGQDKTERSRGINLVEWGGGKRKILESFALGQCLKMPRSATSSLKAPFILSLTSRQE